MTISPKKYAELVAIQNKAKAITQKSYHLSILEKKYPINEAMTDDKANELIYAYEAILA